jgi:hypothetical protein
MEGGDFSMSSIDERVVEMKFDNKQFAKGASESISSLDKLKSALNLDGVSKGLQGLNDAGKNFNLGGLSDSVDTLASRFSGLQAVAIGALVAIGSQVTNLAVNIAQKLGAGVTQSLRDGFSDYTAKLTSVQTIMNATGAPIEKVNGYFKELDTYSDKTVYNLSDMTGAFAKFTNAGVGMDKSVPAIKGIANMVALAGQGAGEAGIAMYNLSQSIAGGFLTTTDYKSLNFANVATKEWKNNMIAAAVSAGTLQKTGSDAYHIVGTKAGSAASSASLFNESLSEGWASADVLLGVLGDYGDETTAIGKKALAAAQDIKSIPMMMETLAASAGTGWTDSFEIMLGNVTESTKLFTMLTGNIQKFTDESSNARNAQLQVWKDMGGRQAIVDSIQLAFKALNNVLDPIKAAWTEVFPPSLGKTLTHISVAIRHFVASLVLTPDAMARVHDVAKILFIVLKFGFNIISTLAEVGGFLIGVFFKMAGALLGLLGPVIDFFTALALGKDKAADTTDKFFDLSSALEWLNTYAITPVIAGINWLSDAFGKLMKGDPAAWAEKARGAFGGLIGMGENAADVWSRVVGFFKKIWEFVGPLVQGMGDGLKDLGKNIEDAFSQIDWNAVIAGINTGFLAMIILSIKKYFDQGASFLEKFTGVFQSVSDTLKAFQQDIKAGALIKIAIAILLLAGALVLLSQVNPENLGPALAAMATSIVTLLGALKLMEKFISDDETGKLGKLAFVLILLSASLLIMAVAIAKLAGLDMVKLAAGTGALVIMLYAMVGAVMILDKIKEDMPAISAVLLALATAMITLSTAVLILGMMPFDQLVQGMVAMGIILAALVGAIMLLSINNTATWAAAAALVAIAGAIAILVGSILILGLIPIQVLVQGIASLAILLGLLVGAILLMSVNNAATFAAAAALLAMAFAMNILVTAVIALGLLPIDVLIQGITAIALLLTVLAGTMYAMTGTLLGALATLVVAAALIVLAAAVFILGSMPFDMVVQGLLSLVLAILTMAAITLVLTPLIPLMFLVGIALAAAGVGIMLMAGAMVVFSIGLALFGPAAMLASGGLKVLAAAIMVVAKAVPAFLLVGAGLLAFGIGAGVAGVGILILAGGLLLLGVALALLGAVGIIGATATIAVVNALMKLMGKAIQMGLLGVAFTALGAGLTVLGVGAVLAGVGLMGVALALLMLAGGATLGAFAMTLMGKAVTKLSNRVEDMKQVASAIKTLASSASAASSGVNSTASGLNKLASAASSAGSKSTKLISVSKLLSQALAQMLTVVRLVPQAFALMASASNASINTFKMGVVNAVPQVAQAAARMIASMISTIMVRLSASRGSMGASGYGIGSAIVTGMRNGLNDGSYLVTNAARAVAARALQASKDELGVASPSKEYHKIGIWNDQGLADGQLDGVNVVEDASRTVAKAALNALSRAMSGAGNILSDNMDFNPTITPVLDLSKIQENASLISSLLTPPTLDVNSSYARATALAQEQQVTEPSTSEDTSSGSTVTFIQNNSSPKAINTADVYRNTKNQLSTVKKGLTTSAN